VSAPSPNNPELKDDLQPIGEEAEKAVKAVSAAEHGKPNVLVSFSVES
jgi:hypothetical protein